MIFLAVARANDWRLNRAAVSLLANRGSWDYRVAPQTARRLYRLILQVSPADPLSASASSPQRQRQRRPLNQNPAHGAGFRSYSLIATEKRLLFRTHVLDASNMLWIDASSIWLNSSSDCCADSPSLKAREKLATMP